MDNTIKVWHKNKKRWLKEHEYVLGMSVETDDIAVYQAYCEEQAGTEEWESRVDFEDEITEEVVILKAVGIKDKNGIRLYANDIIHAPNGTMYIIQYERLVAGWEAWDFKAWAKGYYDAYIPLKDVGCIVMEDCDPPCTPEPKFYDVVRLGTTFENPELCPEIFDKTEV